MGDTEYDGTWSGSITLPQSTAPGSYYVHALAWDQQSGVGAHVSSSEAATWTSSAPLDNDPTVAVVDSTTP